LAAAGRRQRAQPEWRNDLATDLGEWSELIHSLSDPSNERLKRRDKMRFIEHNERVGAKKPGLVGLRPARNAVSFKMKP
jgi:hypothetical protein